MMVVFGVLVFGMPGAMATTPGLAYSEDIVFTVLDDSVRVDTVVVMSNTTAERRSGDTIYYSYFDEFVVVVPTQATELWVTSRGSSLTTTRQHLDEDFDLVTARLPAQLRSGQSRTVDVSFVLPKGEIRGDGVFFSNPAFHAFPIWSFSDPGSGSLRVRVPEAAELSQFGQDLTLTGTDGGYDVWEPVDFSQPDEVFSYVSVTLEQALETTNFSVSGQDIVLRTWPGDAVWVTFARDTIEIGLPALEELIGLPVPDQDSLEITESVTPYYYGYGGWYDPVQTAIEVGNELDDTVMLHELSHAWFNNALFRERWVAEGLAEEFTWQAQRALDWPTEPLPRMPDTQSTSATPLIDWGNGATARIGDDAFRSREEYGYNASWFVVHELVGIVGVDGMQQAIAAADGNIISYLGEDPDERTSKSDDWKRLLDLLTEAGMVEEAAAIERVFVDYVVRPSSMAELDQRRAARAAYADLVAQDLGWSTPAGIRSALTEWKFDEALDAIERATEVQARHRDLVVEANRAGLDVSEAVRDAYESDGSDRPEFAKARKIIDEKLEAIPLVEAVRTTYGRDLTTNQRWGIGDVDLAPLVAIAEEAYGQDNSERITAAQLELDRTLAAAEAVGAERIRWTAIGSASVGLMLAVVLSVTRRRDDETISELEQADVVLSA